MKKTFKTIISIILCVLLTTGILVFVVVSTLNAAIFSGNFLSDISDSQDYSNMVMSAIQKDVEAQSSYVGIPADVLLEGFDKEILQVKLNEYVKTTVDFLNYRADFIQMDFPDDFFIPPLTAFLESEASANDYVPTDEQYKLIEEVSWDTSKIIEKHIDLFQLKLLSKATFFKELHHRLYFAGQMGLPALWVILICISCLFMLHGFDTGSALFLQFTSFWTAGCLISIPMTVLGSLQLTTRLAIETPYLKYAVDTVLTNVSDFALFLGILLFILSSIGLTISFFKKYCIYLDN